jgi:hypothetical protein
MNCAGNDAGAYDGDENKSANGSISANTWHNWIVTQSVSGSGTQNAYLDGTLVSVSPITKKPSFYSTNWFLGRMGNFSNGSNALTGYMQDVCFWNKVIPASTISALQTTQVKSLSDKSGIKAYYPLDVAPVSNVVINEAIADTQGASVSSLTDKSGLKAHYTMDGTALEALKNTPDYTFNFSSDTDWDRVGSGTSNTVYIDTSAGHIRHNTTTNTSSMKKVYYNLEDYTSGSAVNDSKWTMRFKWVITNQNAPSSWLMALSHNTNDPDATSFNGIGIQLNDQGGSYGYHICTCDGSTKTFSSNVTTPSNSQTLYVELARTSATKAKLTMWSDSYGGTEVGTSQELTIPSGVTTLKYLQSGSGQGGNSSRTMNATLDDLEIFDDSIQLDGCKNDASATSELDAMTNIPTNTIFEQTDDTPSYWWKQSNNTWKLDGTSVTFSDDFSTTKSGWTFTDTAKVGVTGGKMLFDSVHDNSYDGASYDLGTALSDTLWVMRFKWTIDATSGSGSNGSQGFIGMSASPLWDGSTPDRDIIGLSFVQNSNTLDRIMIASDRTNNPMNFAQSAGRYSNVALAQQTYYVQIQRTGALTSTVKISTTDAHDGDTFSKDWSTSQYGSSNEITDLKYIWIQAQKDSGGATFTTSIDDLEIINGRSTWIE